MLALFFVAGLYSGYAKTALFWFVANTYDDVVLIWEEKETLARLRPEKFLQKARYPGAGVTINNAPEGEKDLLLLAGFFGDGNELRLIRRDGTVVARWPVNVTGFFGKSQHLLVPPTTDWHAAIHGAIILPDGAVVFNFDRTGLVKIDRCGNLAWKLDRMTHHSVERAEGGGFWVSGRNLYPRGAESPFPPFAPPFFDDTLLKVSEDGEVLVEISLTDLLLRNGLHALLTLTGDPNVRGMRTYLRSDDDTLEIFHSNDVEELPRQIAGAFPIFSAGDLLVSLRNRNLLLVLDPESLKVKWWQTGPWVRQHDPDFQPDGTITVFDNNTDNTADGTSWGGSTIMKIDPMTNRSWILYGGNTAQPLYSSEAGKHQIYANDRILVTEEAGGRVFELDENRNVTWEYINRYDDETVAEVTSALRYPLDYFTVKDWWCGVASQ